MDPLRSYLGRLLQEEITPVIMVLSTPLVEDACQKNGLNFIELLLPFSVLHFGIGWVYTGVSRHGTSTCIAVPRIVEGQDEGKAGDQQLQVAKGRRVLRKLCIKEAVQEERRKKRRRRKNTLRRPHPCVVTARGSPRVPVVVAALVRGSPVSRRRPRSQFFSRAGRKIDATSYTNQGSPYRVVRLYTSRYVPVRQLTGMRTVRYRAKKKEEEEEKKKEDYLGTVWYMVLGGTQHIPPIH
ncbi:hypothetical protein BHE74_00032393 [Ensete ventricosum]|nr:hypothetical protein BHE74_00032393 [Ensete ventricosum]